MLKLSDEINEPAQGRPLSTDACAPPSPWRLNVGASLVLVRAGVAVWEPSGKAAVVLAWVALEGHAARRRLAMTLWPDSEPGQARSNLRVLVHRINQRGGCELLVGAEQLTLDGSRVQLNLHDAESVLSALRSGGAERCELLAEAGIEAEAGEELQAWLQGARQRLKRSQLAVLSQALTEALAGARHEHAVALARACVQLEPLSEQRHRQLMDTLVRGEDRAAALTAYEECKQVLSQRLGVLPELRTRTVQLRILQEQAQVVEQAHEPEQRKAPEADGLTPLGGAARYPLVEREAVLAQAQAALAQGVHVMVHGEPGVGKTRLLRHLAAEWGGQVEPLAVRWGIRQEPYAALAQWLQEVQPQRAPRIGVPEQIELARLAPLAFADVKPSEGALSAPRLHAALRHWVTRLAQAGVRVLVLDDVQYADAASQAAIGALLAPTAEHDEQTPTLLLAHRSGEIEPTLEEALVAAQVQRRARSIALPRLSLPGVRALLQSLLHAAQRSTLPAAQTEALGERLFKRTGGNPLFVIELAQQALEQGDAADMASLQALLGSRLKGCSPPAQQLAAVAAVAADDFTVELAAAVTGQPALGLMPAWAELQQRGLFAEHGLAHDLVQEAVLAELPQAILQRLHRQLAQQLERQGQQGAPVLRHWLAADDADRALPHAVHQLHATSAAGLSAVQQELQMLTLLERCSDTALMDNLWLTAEVNGGTNTAGMFAQAWPRLRALRLRVERLPQHATSDAWIAFETARDHYQLGHSAKAAYEVLAPMADRLPAHGIERAWTECELAGLADALIGDPRQHLERARTALTGLPQHLSFKRLRMEIHAWVAYFLDPVEGIRTLAERRRAGRRRGDLAMVADTSRRIAYTQVAAGNVARAYRHYCRSAQTQQRDADDLSGFKPYFPAGGFALSSGHYATSQRLFAMNEDPTYSHDVPVLQTLLHLRLGDLRQARAYQSEVHPELLRRKLSIYLIHAQVCAELDELEGRDPMPALRQLLGPEQTRALGIGGDMVEQFAWELIRRTRSAAEQLEPGHALLAALRRTSADRSTAVKISLEVAEAHAQARVPGAQALAAEAARLLRRGYETYTLYLPEGLVRCARLLRHSDPREADALIYVARRWVSGTLQRLPQGTEQTFMHNVAVNRLLLGQDERALYGGPL